MKRNAFIFPILLLFIALSHTLYMSLLVVSYYKTQREYVIQHHYALNVQDSLIKSFTSSMVADYQHNLAQTLTNQLTQYTYQQLSDYRIVKEAIIKPNHYQFDAYLNDKHYRINVKGLIYLDSRGKSWINQDLFPIHGLFKNRKRQPFNTLPKNEISTSTSVARQSTKYYTFDWQIPPPPIHTIVFTNGYAHQTKSNGEYYYSLSLNNDTLNKPLPLFPTTLSIQIEWIATFETLP